MSKKSKIIMVLIAFAVFFIILLMIVIFKTSNAKKTNENDPSGPSYASNSTRITETSEYVPSVQETAMGHMYEKAYYDHIEYLNPEQRTDSDHMIVLVENYAKNQGKEIQWVEIQQNSNEEVIFMTVTYTDASQEDIVVTYGNYSFLRCASKEYYDFIESGGCADGE